MPDAVSRTFRWRSAGTRRLITLARRYDAKLPVGAVVVAGIRMLITLPRRRAATPFHWRGRRRCYTEADYTCPAL